MQTENSLHNRGARPSVGAILLASAAVIGLASSVAAGVSSGFDETWDSGTNNKWAYWDTDYGVDPHHHHPMEYVANGGVGDTGYVRTPLAEMEPAQAHTLWAYWPAYPGEDFATEPFPYIDLTIPGAAISVYVNGERDPLGPSGPVDLAGGEVRFFIGYYDTKGTEELEDDEQAFFCTKGTFDVGDDFWDKTTVVLGGDADWLTIVKDEGAGTDTHPTDLYDGPQQWGFTIYPVGLNQFPGGGSLGFDEFHLVPVPTTMALLAVGGLAVIRRRVPLVRNCHK